MIQGRRSWIMPGITLNVASKEHNLPSGYIILIFLSVSYIILHFITDMLLWSRGGGGGGWGGTPKKIV